MSTGGYDGPAGIAGSGLRRTCMDSGILL